MPKPGRPGRRQRGHGRGRRSRPPAAPACRPAAPPASPRRAAGFDASAGNSFSASAPAASIAKASVGVAKPGQANMRCRLRLAHDARVGVWGDDQPAAGRLDRLHLLGRHHRAGADQQPRRRSASRARRMLSMGSRRVERHLDDADAGLDEARAHLHRLRRAGCRAGSPPAGSAPSQSRNVVIASQPPPPAGTGRAPPLPRRAPPPARRARRSRASRARTGCSAPIRCTLAPSVVAAGARPRAPRGRSAGRTGTRRRPRRRSAPNSGSVAHAEQVVQQVRRDRRRGRRRGRTASASWARRASVGPGSCGCAARRTPRPVM